MIINPSSKTTELHRPERKMRQNKEISHYIFFILKNI